jgi:hypothetical protein
LRSSTSICSSEGPSFIRTRLLLAPASTTYGGIPLGLHIVQKVDGMVVLNVRLTEVTPNAGLILDIPSVEHTDHKRNK